MTITEMLSTLNEIAATADRDRLLVWYPEFCREFPVLSGLIEECLALPAAAVLPHLERGHTGLGLMLSLMGPEWAAKLEKTVQFVHATLNERLNSERQ